VQWLINEFKAFKLDVMNLVEKRFSELKTELPKNDLAERVSKLEGEIKAMKMRMGKGAKD
jgi:hypothetical protein